MKADVLSPRAWQPSATSSVARRALAVSEVAEPAQRPVADPRIQATVDGDRAAAESLASELLPRVGNLVRYLIGADSDVEDVSQKVLIEVLRNLHSFRGDSKLTTWVDRITVRVTMAEMRRRKRDAERLRAAAQEFVDDPPISSPPDSAYATRRQAVHLLDQLCEEQRQAVVLHHIVGMSVPELARHLSIPFETTRSRLRLGIRKLRALMSADEENP